MAQRSCPYKFEKILSQRELKSTKKILLIDDDQLNKLCKSNKNIYNITNIYIYIYIYIYRKDNLKLYIS